MIITDPALIDALALADAGYRDKAVKRLTDLAFAGRPTAASALATLYEPWNGADADAAQVVDWYATAAHMGAAGGAAVGGPIGAVAVPAVAYGARRGAEAMTRGNAAMAEAAVRSGSTPAGAALPSQSLVGAGQGVAGYLGGPANPLTITVRPRPKAQLR